jgi:hypothetical protein
MSSVSVFCTVTYRCENRPVRFFLNNGTANFAMCETCAEIYVQDDWIRDPKEARRIGMEELTREEYLVAQVQYG